MPTRAKLIQLIHVAKRELGLDDTAYREAIASVAKGKSSCAQLLDRELEALLASFKSAGFKRRTNPHQKRRLSPPSEAPVKTAEIRKIRAIWIAMPFSKAAISPNGVKTPGAIQSASHMPASSSMTMRLSSWVWVVRS